MLIRNPNNPYPQNIAVDATQEYFAFTFMGDRLGSYEIEVKPYSEVVDFTQFNYVTIGHTDIINYAFNNDRIISELSIWNYLSLIDGHDIYDFIQTQIATTRVDYDTKILNIAEEKQKLNDKLTTDTKLTANEKETLANKIDELTNYREELEKRQATIIADMEQVRDNYQTEINQYTWRIQMYSDVGADGENFTSISYYFETLPLPSVYSTTLSQDDHEAFLINGQTVEYSHTTKDETNNIIVDVPTLNGRNINILGYYGLNNLSNIKYYYFELFDEEDRLIENTDKIFSTKIEFSFSGLMPNNAYAVKLHIVTQSDQYLNFIFQLNVDYAIKSSVDFKPILTCNEEEASIEIKWAKDSTAVGKPSQDADYGFENGTLMLDTGSITYDTISNLPIAMETNNFTVGLKTLIDTNTTKIFDYVNNNILYEVYLENYRFYLRYGSIDSDNKQIIECGQFYENIIFGIQDNQDIQPNTGYVFTNNTEDQVTNSETSYLIVNDVADDQWLSILLQNDNGLVSCNITKLEI